MSAARRVLERLLRRAENARRRSADEHVSLPMTSASSAGEYVTLGSLDDLDHFHGEIALAERGGAVIARRDCLRGDGTRLLRLTVADAGLLAKHLGVQLLDERVADAERCLEAWTGRFPVLADVIAAWRRGRKVRGCGPEAAETVGLAAKAVAAREADVGHERILRRESVRLFGDSKQLEKLTSWLELLVVGELTATGLVKEEVWSAIGLRREPQPFLLSGDGEVELINGIVPLVRPYLGLPVESLRSVVTSAHCVLTIENLASFHDATRASGANAVLLLYTGGMPSPAWRAAYARILHTMPHGLPVYHWGDIDEGGFRIAAVLAASAKEAGRHLRPWRMSPRALPADAGRHAAVPTHSALKAMQRFAVRADWPELADDLQQQPMQLEQELIESVLPLPQT